MKLLNEKRPPENQIPLRISVVNRTLNKVQIVELQMSENLHNQMTSAQDAAVIHDYWLKVRDAYGDSFPMAELARRLGRSPEVVRNSIHYVENVNELVQEMVSNGSISYSIALLLSKYQKGDKFESEQLRFALLFVAKEYSLKQAKEYLRKLKDDSEMTPLFDPESWKELNFNPAKIALRKESDLRGKEAITWFVRIIKAIKNLKDPMRVEFSDAIKQSVLTLGLSLEDFKEIIKGDINPKEFKELFGSS